MTIDNRSANQNYKLPNPQNLLTDDAQRLIDAINAIDADVFDRYTKAEVDQAIADLIDGAPQTLDTLNEIAAALADDSNYFTTINNALATKVNLTGGNTITGDQAITGDITGTGDIARTGDVSATNLDISGSGEIGNIAGMSTTAGQGTAQTASTSNGKGFVETPWVYANCIEAATEKGAASTGIALGTGGHTNSQASNADEIKLFTAGDTRLTVGASGVTTANVGFKAPYFEVTDGGKIADVTGQYGSIKVTGGATTSYDGYAIEAGAVFMAHTNGTTFGLYDDTNNNWSLKHTKGGATELYHDGTSKVITRSDGASVEGQLIVDANIIPDSDDSGEVGTSDRTFANGRFTNLTVDSTLTVRSAIDLADNDQLRLGSGDDAKIYHNGSHLYFDMNLDDDIYFRDVNSTNANRFWFDISSGDFDAAHNIDAGRISSTYTNGVHSITAYGRNSGTHGSDAWSAIAQMIADYRGDGNDANNEDTAMFYARQRNSSNTERYLHNLDVRGRSWHISTIYAGRGRQSTTSTAANQYGWSSTQESSVYAYAGSSGSFTYISGRNVADTQFVYQADVSTPRIEFQADGNGRFDGGADIGNADYAEMFEWSDGNPDAEDRRGYAVCLDGEKIRFATNDDLASDIIGIVSAEPGVLGDSASLNWQAQHLKDEFGRKLREPIEWLVWNPKGDDQPVIGNNHSLSRAQERCRVSDLGTGNEADQLVPDYAREHNARWTTYALVENPEYDKTQNYVPRRDRQEWDAIGMLGKLALRKGQPVGDRWLKLKVINDDLELWLVR